MKWMIRVDMEGLTGVVDMAQVVPGASEFAFGKQMLKHDLLAVIDGLLQREDDRVVLYDIHFYGRNVDFDWLDPRVSAICGKPNYTPANGSFLDASFDGVVLLGLHAKAETPGAVLNHNYEHDIRSIHVNGLCVGEIGLEALMAGEAGVPLVLVTADDEGCRETEALLPGTLTACVKESRGIAAALCYSPAVTGPLLTKAAAACADAARRLQPFTVAGPIELALRFKPGALLDKLRGTMAAHMVGADRFVIRGDSVIAAWEQYLIAKA
ncbi:M55 family metallopeptidase [Paenibacillus cymbidii]|uniref:M55 family metallopeptidase n=1 Tax=Paenibacillus cymbidii TaxID=1639034 RepID=UPI0010819F49|nr:M55 family metallopeptidase [Paenibacillus cymbidii]